jgi:hypothetical protein
VDNRRPPFLDGWNLCAWQHGTATTGRMPDITRRTEARSAAALV